MNKLTSIRIKQNDGTYSDDIPVQVLADNVVWTEGSTVSLTDILGQVKYTTKGSIQHQLDIFSLDEVENARVGADDTQYQNLKARLDGEYEDLQDAIAAVAANLQTQTGARSNADTAIRTDLSSEITSRINGDNILSGQINAEISARQAAMNSEVTARNNAINSAIASEASARANAISAEATARQAQIAALQGAVGSPLVAATAAAMTDHTKIYVYTGSESGKTAGHWYYWNGSVWADGGVYNSTALETDKTLSVSNMPADGLVSGLGKKDIAVLGDSPVINWEQGGFASGGGEISANNRIRTKLIKFNKGSRITSVGYGRSALMYYTPSGLYLNATTLEASDITIESDCYGRIFAAYTDNAAITPSQANKVVNVFVNNSNAKICADERVANEEYGLNDGLLKGYYILNTTSVGEVYQYRFTTDTGWRTKKFPVKQGEVIYIENAYGGNASRLWALLDKNDVLLSVASANLSGTAIRLTAQQDGYLIINFSTNNASSKLTLVNHSRKVEDTLSYTTTFNKWGYINTNVGIGNVVDTNYIPYSALSFKILKVYSGDTIRLSGSGGNDSRLWALTDNDYKLISISNANATAVSGEWAYIPVDIDGYLIANNVTATIPGATISIFRNANKAASDTGFLLNDTAALYEKMLEGISSKQYCISEVLPNGNYIPDTLKENSLGTASVELLNTVYGWYDNLVLSNPDYVTVETLGNDTSGSYPVKKYKFRMPNINENYSNIPVIYIESALHGSERPAVMAVYNFLYDLCNNYDKDIFLTWLRCNCEIVVLPIANPWGFVNSARGNSNHVDLNRNFDYRWSSGDSDQTSENYRGTSAFSELETQYINNVITSSKPLLIMDYHTYGSGDTRWQDVFCLDVACSVTSALDNDYRKKVGVAQYIVKNVSMTAVKSFEQNLDEYIATVPLSTNYASIANYYSYKGYTAISPECAYNLKKNSYSAVYDDATNKLNYIWVYQTLRSYITHLLSPYIL